MANVVDLDGMRSNSLQHLTANDWVLIQAKASRHNYPLGTEIVREGEWPKSIFIIRRGEASVELAASGTRTIVASLGPDDICGEMSFLEQGKATAAVIASTEEVEVDEVDSRELRALFVAFPGLASRFYQSLSMILAQRLRETSKELAREMALRDRSQK
jgi:CRP-like cAMP-binding protein